MNLLKSLLRDLKSADWEKRYWSARFLARMAGRYKGAVSPLIEAMKDPDPAVRYKVGDALMYAPRPNKRLLSEASSMVVENMRKYAPEKVSNNTDYSVNGDETFDLLIEAYFCDIEYSWLALEHVGKPLFSRVIRTIEAFPSDDKRFDDGLLLLIDGKYIPDLRRLSLRGSQKMRSMAIHVLGLLAHESTKALQGLMALRNSRDPGIRREVLCSIQHNTIPEAIWALEEMTRDSDLQVRHLANDIMDRELRSNRFQARGNIRHYLANGYKGIAALKELLVGESMETVAINGVPATASDVKRDLLEKVNHYRVAAIVHQRECAGLSVAESRKFGFVKSVGQLNRSWTDAARVLGRTQLYEYAHSNKKIGEMFNGYSIADYPLGTLIFMFID
jgi:hypothetical protein